MDRRSFIAATAGSVAIAAGPYAQGKTGDEKLVSMVNEWRCEHERLNDPDLAITDAEFDIARDALFQREKDICAARADGIEGVRAQIDFLFNMDQGDLLEGYPSDIACILNNIQGALQAA